MQDLSHRDHSKETICIVILTGERMSALAKVIQ